MICILAGAAFARALAGQELHVSASEARAGSPGSFLVTLDAPADKRPVALQLEVAIPAALTVRPQDITTGSAAESAKKSITCAGKAENSRGAARYTCILAGGRQPIGNGAVVVVLYRPRADAPGVPIRVAIENISGVSADLRRIPMPNTEAVITVRR